MIGITVPLQIKLCREFQVNLKRASLQALKVSIVFFTAAATSQRKSKNCHKREACHGARKQDVKVNSVALSSKLELYCMSDRPFTCEATAVIQL